MDAVLDDIDRCHTDAACRLNMMRLARRIDAIEAELVRRTLILEAYAKRTGRDLYNSITMENIIDKGVDRRLRSLERHIPTMESSPGKFADIESSLHAIGEWVNDQIDRNLGRRVFALESEVNKLLKDSRYGDKKMALKLLKRGAGNLGKLNDDLLGNVRNFLNQRTRNTS